MALENRGKWLIRKPQLLPDNDALVLRVDHHVAVHVVGEGVDVRRIFVGRLVEKSRTMSAQMRLARSISVPGTWVPIVFHRNRRNAGKFITEKLGTYSALVLLDFPLREIGHWLKWVDGNQYGSDVRLQNEN